MNRNKELGEGEIRMNACAMKPQMPFATKGKLKRTPATSDNKKLVEFLDSHDFSFSIDKDTGNISSSVIKKEKDEY